MCAGYSRQVLHRNYLRERSFCLGQAPHLGTERASLFTIATSLSTNTKTKGLKQLFSPENAFLLGKVLLRDKR